MICDLAEKRAYNSELSRAPLMPSDSCHESGEIIQEERPETGERINRAF